MTEVLASEGGGGGGRRRRRRNTFSPNGGGERVNGVATVRRTSGGANGEVRSLLRPYWDMLNYGISSIRCFRD